MLKGPEVEFQLADSGARTLITCRRLHLRDYLDTFSFGLTADRDAVPDLAIVVDGIGRGLAELGKDE